MLREEFLREIEQFIALSGMPHTAFGKESIKDASFVARLRAGRDVKVGTIERVRNWMDANRHRVRQAAE